MAFIHRPLHQPVIELSTPVFPPLAWSFAPGRLGMSSFTTTCDSMLCLRNSSSFSAGVRPLNAQVFSLSATVFDSLPGAEVVEVGVATATRAADSLSEVAVALAVSRAFCSSSCNPGQFDRVLWGRERERCREKVYICSLLPPGIHDHVYTGEYRKSSAEY